MRNLAWAGPAFVLAVLGLVVGGVADVAFVSTSHRSGHDYGGLYTNAERGVLAKSVVARPGDRLAIQPNLMGPWPTFMSYDFYVVDGGDRFALLDGQAPRSTYVHVANLSLQGCCSEPWLSWDRPDDAAAHRAPRPAAAQDAAPREMELAALDKPERIDLVWVLQYGPNVTQPATEQERSVFDSRLEAAFRERLGFSSFFEPGAPTVYRASVVSAQPAIELGLAALALLAVASALAWAVRLRRARFDPEGPGAEDLLRLYDSAGAYLASLRDLLVGSLMVVVGVAVHVALTLSGLGAEQRLLRLAGVGPFTGRVLGVALLLAYCAVAVVWGHAGWSVHRALRRWRARRGGPPLDVPAEV